MRKLAIALCATPLLLSVWLLYQVRSVNETLNSQVVSEYQSQLIEARRIEDMLRAGRLDDALAHLQRNRDIFVVSLSSVHQSISEPSWRWPKSDHIVQRIDSSLSDEARYRDRVGQSDGVLARQVYEVLSEY